MDQASTLSRQTPPPALSRARSRSHLWLNRAAQGCFAAIALGQLLFLTFILTFYYPTTLRGDWAEWNRKPLIDGFKEGDGAGNLIFATHVILAAVITAGGLMQLVPALRNRLPTFHRWNGRIYMLTGVMLALGGLWLVWVRGTYLTMIGAVGISANAVAILAFAILSWRSARDRRFVQHRRWALRLFAVVSAVWFMRVGYMAWAIATSGAGVGKAMDGPFDVFIAFGNSLIPLALTEAYLQAQAREHYVARYVVAALLAACVLVIAVGSVGAWLMMWSPYL